MKNYIKLLSLIFILNACTTITRYDKAQLNELKSYNINTDNPQISNWDKPKNPLLAGGLNILPGFGNFYLSSYDSSQSAYGIINFLTWPLSTIWSIPQAIIDANRINELDLLNHYRYDKQAKEKFNQLKQI